MSEEEPISEAAAIEQLGALVERQRIDAARALLANVLPSYPDSLHILYYAAWTEFLDDQEDAAKQIIGRMLELEPEHYGARYLLVRIHEHLHEFPQAELVVTALLREYPEEVELYAVYARIMLATNQFERAGRLADEALRRDPDNESALNTAVLTTFINSPGEQTREQLAKLVAEHPEQMQTTLRVVQLLIAEGRHDEAYALTRELVQMDPSNQALVQLATDLKVSSHWSMKPMWPMRKWGWGGSIAIWLIVVALVRIPVLESVGLQDFTGPIVAVFLVYVVYSWVWPWLFKRIVGAS